MACTSETRAEHQTGCSKSPDFSPAQPWLLFHPPALSLPRQTLRPGTRLVPSKAAANYHLLRGGWDDPNCPQRSHPPTHWHAETCHLPGRGPSGFPHFALRGTARLSFTARIGRAPFYRARSASTKDGLAAPPPALLRPRVARAQGSSQPPRPLFQHPARGVRASGESLCQRRGSVWQAAVPVPAADVRRISRSDLIRY